MFHITVTVKRRPVILDPQGKAVEQGAKLLGFENVSDVRIDRLIEFNIKTENLESANEEAHQLCTKLLTNPIMEDYELKVQKI